jgi:site-specific DNA-methyltransferase (adenine-specific)
MKMHESVLLFCADSSFCYNPQMQAGKAYSATSGARSAIYNSVVIPNWTTVNQGDRYPTSIIDISSPANTEHETQKPIALYEYLLRTYSNPGDLILDPCAGSCTTAIAAYNTDRQFICIEQDETYYNAGQTRLTTAMSQPRLFALSSLDEHNQRKSKEAQGSFELEGDLQEAI